MLDKDKIIGLLEEEDLTDVEVLKEEDGMLVIRFFYDFDEDEISAADAFSKDNEDIDFSKEDDEVIISEERVRELEDEMIDDEDEDDEYYDEEEDDEYYASPKLKYLSDIAVDHVGEVLEEIKEEEDIEIQYIGYDMDEDLTDYYEFVALFFEKGLEMDIDEVLEDMDI